jgi:uncharacterized protein (DUF1501 family)
MKHDPCIDRRKLLIGAGAFGALALGSATAGATVRLFGERTGKRDERDPRTLVLLQLSGGNDGLSMVVPFGDDAYYENRTSTAIAAGEVLRIDDYRGLHPGLAKLRAAYEQGELCIVEGAGYPRPIRSHFKSLEIWHTAHEQGRNSGEGWIGRLCDAAWGKAQTPELVVHVGATAPYSVYSTTHPAVSFQTPASYKWVAPESEDREMYERAGAETKNGGDTVLARLRGVLTDAQESSLRIRRAAADYKPRHAYPDDDLGAALRVVAALLDARIGSRVLSVELGGFDTHNNQRQAHDQLMRRLDAALAAFLADVKGTSAGDNTLVLAFSEFGRRLKENGSRGTDHGVAAPMLLAGTKVKGGLHGKHPSLDVLDDGDLVHTTDFRSVYGTLIEKWFDVAQERVLGAEYPLLPLLRA